MYFRRQIFLTIFSLSVAGCKSDSECPLTQACINRECQDPCPFEQCGQNAECSVRNHKAKCTCLPQHKGNPYVICTPYECLIDPDCHTTKACRNEKCVDPCDCAENADCSPRNHRGICTCIPGYTGDPYGIRCTPIPPPPDDRCKEDKDCPSKEACIDRECVDPCRAIQPCADNARCDVYSTLPLRTMTCTCLPGYTGKGDVRCDKILPPEPVGCSSDSECGSSQACRNRQCINPCHSEDPCAPSAICSVDNHRPKCQCPPGFTGNPRSQCSKIKRGECDHDDECPDNTACIEHQCLDPCRISEPCGQGALCETTSHRAVCRCPPTWGGNPHEECFQYECLIDDDCPYDKACVNKECTNPCQKVLCGERAECKAEAHKAVCFCPLGLQGNPLVACREVGCRSNSECPTTEVCDYLPSGSKKECQPLCIRNPCATGARCEAQNHRETCTCIHPLQGDGYVSCTEIRIPDEPECRIDEDCPSKLTCMRETCQNPCIVTNPCSSAQTCVVRDTLPTRTVACLCPDGFVFQDNGQCVKGIFPTKFCRTFYDLYYLVYS